MSLLDLRLRRIVQRGLGWHRTTATPVEPKNGDCDRKQQTSRNEGQKSSGLPSWSPRHTKENKALAVNRQLGPTWCGRLAGILLPAWAIRFRFRSSPCLPCASKTVEPTRLERWLHRYGCTTAPNIDDRRLVVSRNNFPKLLILTGLRMRISHSKECEVATVRESQQHISRRETRPVS